MPLTPEKQARFNQLEARNERAELNQLRAAKRERLGIPGGEFEEVLTPAEIRDQNARFLGGVQGTTSNLARAVPGFAGVADKAEAEDPEAFGGGESFGTALSFLGGPGSFATKGAAKVAAPLAKKIPFAQQAIPSAITQAGGGAGELGIREAVDASRGEQKPGGLGRVGEIAAFGGGVGAAAPAVSRGLNRFGTRLFRRGVPEPREAVLESQAFQAERRLGAPTTRKMDPAISETLVKEKIVARSKGDFIAKARIRKKAVGKELDEVIARADEKNFQPLEGREIKARMEKSIEREISDLGLAAESDLAAALNKKILALFPDDELFSLIQLQAKKKAINKILRGQGTRSADKLFNPTVAKNVSGELLAQREASSGLRKIIEEEVDRAFPAQAGVVAGLNKRIGALQQSIRNVETLPKQGLRQFLNTLTFGVLGGGLAFTGQAAGVGALPATAAGVVGLGVPGFLSTTVPGGTVGARAALGASGLARDQGARQLIGQRILQLREGGDAPAEAPPVNARRPLPRTPGGP